MKRGYVAIQRHATTSLLVLVALISASLRFGKIFPDSTSYREYSLFILGRSPTVSEIVAMRPMLPLIASLISFCLGDIDSSYALANAVFYVLGTLVAYRLGELTFASQKIGVLAALIYATSPAMLWFGAAVLVDAPAYFFTGLAVLLAFGSAQETGPKWRNLLEETGATVGLLFKESVAFSILYLLFVRAYQKRGFRRVLASTFLIVVVDVGVLAYLSLDPFIFVRKLYLAQQSAGLYEPSKWGLILLGKSFVNAFFPYFPTIVRYSIYPLFVTVGFLSTEPARRNALLTCLAFLSLNAVVWPVMTYRFSFMTWPVVIPLLAGGIERLSERCCSLVGLHKGFHVGLGCLIVFLGAIVTILQIAS